MAKFVDCSYDSPLFILQDKGDTDGLTKMN